MCAAFAAAQHNNASPFITITRPPHYCREHQAKGFTDENAKWLKPKAKSFDFDSGDDVSDDEPAPQQPPAKRGAAGAKQQQQKQQQQQKGGKKKAQPPPPSSSGEEEEEAEEEDEEAGSSGDDGEGYVDDDSDDIGIQGDEFGGEEGDEGVSDEDEDDEDEDGSDGDGANGHANGGGLFGSDSGDDGGGGGSDDLLGGSDDGEEGGSDDDDDDSDDDDDAQLAVERHSKILDRAARRAQADAEAEARAMAAGLDTNLEEAERFTLPSGQEVEAEGRAPPDLEVVRRRLKETVAVLDDFGKLRAPGRSRGDYLDQLRRDLGAYYGYNAFLLDQILGLFPPAEAVEFLEACEVPRPVSAWERERGAFERDRSRG